ncbi:PAS domain-containing sensor histidine kinase [Piscinibacter gummiphilus]|uniref:PAS domain-containing sensor histidine kinase n=1 Tax=Piscinibacter gummiphilus TaxID=946333 RepID=A0ABZ0CSX3_9BURK|nr:PAS domain-containing sensor histidine kinase [Piscinibacter gummiphilus]WOB07973.1 PAS domain-containing sensor histidine kinase [Piscinibacter gummiphilus]
MLSELSRSLLPVVAPHALQPNAAWSERLQLLLESTGEGIFGIDMDGRCTFVNRAAAEMLGYRTEQVHGRNMHELIHHTHADGRHYPECDCPIFNAFRRGLPCRIDSEVLWRADGSAFSAEYSSHPVIDGGVVQGAVVTIVDITERKRAEVELRQAHEELERRVEERTHALTHALGQLRELSAYLETVREEERTRIAREIHDELGSLLVALKMDVNWLHKRVDDRPPLAAKCEGMGTLIDRAVDNLGRIITDLRPSILDHQGLWAALEWQAQEFIEATELQHELQVHVHHGVEAPTGPQGERWAIAVFRIFQEMLSNVARHARARWVHIRLYVDGPPAPVLHLEVRDDGVGATREALDAPRSYGVMGMRERAGHFGGQLTIDSVPGVGTYVRLTMPLPTEAP